MEQSVSNEGSILVVDDEAAIRESCRRTLAEAGYHVEIARYGEEALLQMEKRNFDFVLTDIRMPGSVNGTDLVKIIKQKTPLTDIVIMTGNPTLETAIPVLKNGAYDYLFKPFNQEFLLSVVHRCFEKRKLADELNREKTLRVELEAAYFELQKVERLKEAFLGRLNHELRTPFVSLFFLLDALKAEAKVGPRLDQLRAGVSRVWEIIQNLLLFADLKRDTASSLHVEIRTDDMVRRLIDKFKPEWERQEVVVKMSAEEKLSTVTGDPQLLERALKHLLLNAIYFNKKGGKVQVDLKERIGHIMISFADTGLGIPADKLSMVFDSFYQVADYLTREIGGLGLGLAIVRRIIEAHGGAITVTSRVGEGSVFEVALPCSQDDSRRLVSGKKQVRYV